MGQIQLGVVSFPPAPLIVSVVYALIVKIAHLWCKSLDDTHHHPFKKDKRGEVLVQWSWKLECSSLNSWQTRWCERQVGFCSRNAIWGWEGVWNVLLLPIETRPVSVNSIWLWISSKGWGKTRQIFVAFASTQYFCCCCCFLKLFLEILCNW